MTSEPTFTFRDLAGITGTGEVNVRLRLGKANAPRVPGASPIRFTLSAIAAAVPDWGARCEQHVAEHAPASTPAGPPAAATVRSPEDAAVIVAKLWIDGDCLKCRRPGERQDDLFRRYAAEYNAERIEVPAHVREVVLTLGRKRLLNIRKAVKAGRVDDLLDGRSDNRKGTGFLDRHPEFRRYIEAHMFHRRHATAAQVERALAADFPGRELPRYEMICREMRRVRSEAGWQLSAVHDPDGHRSRHAPAGGDAAAGIARVNQRWEVDSSPADVMCTDGRPMRIAVIDVFTRRVKVHFASTSNAKAVTGLLRAAILDWGVPEEVRTDGGADYVSKHLTTALAQLPTHHDICPPYTPERKAFVERVFSTLGGIIDEILPGYIGHNVAERKALRDSRSMADRAGRTEAELRQVALTVAELDKIYASAVEGTYHLRRHAGLNGRSPFETAALMPGRHWDMGEEALAILFAEPVPDSGNGPGIRKIQKKGLAVDGRWFDAPVFGGDIAGEPVLAKYDDSDAAALWVFSLSGEFLCRALDYDLAEGVTRAALAADKKHHFREAKRRAKDRQRELERDWNIHEAYRRQFDLGDRQRARIIQLPLKGTPHDSHHSREAARAVESAAEWPESAAEAPAPDPADLEFLRRLAAKEEASRRERERQAAEDQAEMIRMFGGLSTD